MDTPKIAAGQFRTSDPKAAKKNKLQACRAMCLIDAIVVPHEASGAPKK